MKQLPAENKKQQHCSLRKKARNKPDQMFDIQKLGVSKTQETVGLREKLTVITIVPGNDKDQYAVALICLF